MDSIKIIKKHGQPGGMPVITVYVDEDAPGESGKLYEHHINNGSNMYLVTLVTADSTPFTKETLAAFLTAKGFNSATNSLKISSADSIVKRTEGGVTYARVTYIFAASSSSVSIGRSTQALTINDGDLAISSQVTSPLALSSIGDQVIEIN